MQALMGKSPKTPTPQEVYRARKQREEEEKSAFLPPGLVNHGNTCFMNSVLQGLMATPMLADIVRFSLPESYSPILSHRSPQLTNGHGLGGTFEREWEQGMPLGDAFVILMYKAWKSQEERQRSTLSPKELLTKIGSKYDQYLDFRQQDAHELLRHLLDAMRMEELDIIKKRQPPAPKGKRKNKSKRAGPSSPANSFDESHEASTDIPEEERLTSFVDLVFGGQLASILVCEKCKKISCTYEDFNDISLPIKQEDYEKARKRNRIRSIARKLGIRGRTTIRDLEIPEGPRSSSVPASPLRRSEEAEKSFEIVLNDAESRRRSLEHGEKRPALPVTTVEEVIVEEEKTPSDPSKDDGKRFLSVGDGANEEKESQKDEDGWVKLARKISVGVKKNKKRYSKERQKERQPSTIEEAQSDANPDDTIETFVDVKPPPSLQTSPAGSPRLGPSMGLTRFPFPRRSSTKAENASPALSAAATPPRTPETPLASLSQPTSSTSSVPASSTSQTITQADSLKKPSRPSKPVRSESQYLRQLLADIPAPSNPSFNIFRNGPLTHSSPDISELRGSWPKSGNVQSVEGCLRMFTSVEVLDGENMVRCRRCWKMEQGQYTQKGARKDDTDSDEDEDDGYKSDSSASVKIKLVDEDDQPLSQTPPELSGQGSALSLSDNSPAQSPSSHDLPNGYFDLKRKLPYSSTPLTKTSSHNPSVPSISMTAPEGSPPSASATTLVAGMSNGSDASTGNASPLGKSPSPSSLRLPPRHARMPAERNSAALSTSSDSASLSSGETDDEPDGTESSLAASVRSESSVLSGGETDRTASCDESTSPRQLKASKSERAKQVIMRRAYKRYLIATPPPVLVIHLKRFQQIGRSPSQYYSLANLKKLEDPVSFSEYLDIGPYLLPRKDEIMSSGKGKDRNKDAGSRVGCMYRLYAVVVHIGNMLGGHYVAYVALPDKDEGPPDPPPKDSRETASSEPSQASLSPRVDDELPVRPCASRTSSFVKNANPPPQGKSRASQSSASVGSQRQWCYVSDTTVRLATLEEVLQAKAYLCMYEKI